MMEEGTALWKQKKNEELEMELRDQERVRTSQAIDDAHKSSCDVQIVAFS